MIKDVRDRYFDYLLDVSESSWTKQELFPLRILFETEFYDLVPHDENRIADAKQLREDFLKSSQNLPQEIDIIRDMGPANCLEVMVALAERMEFLTNNGDGSYTLNGTATEDINTSIIKYKYAKESEFGIYTFKFSSFPI